MLRLLLTRRWLVWLLVAAVASIACLFLGRWQWHRWESRHANQSTINANYEATPVELTQVLPSSQTPVDPSRNWRQVIVRGTYLTDDTTLVRNRTNDDGKFGFQVLVPLRTTQGRIILVDRGWVPNGATASALPQVPAPRTGQLQIQAWVRPVEQPVDRDHIKGQVASIDPSEIRRQTGLVLDGRAYLRMKSETPAAATEPEQQGRPDLGMAAGINLSYALQWWGAGIAFPVLVFLAARRELPGYIPRSQRPKKVRIWDEEDA
ncbi:SURF1 family protein [Dermacoccaceae bacterium W4C1]